MSKITKKRGKFIVIEGIDGSGKSVQTELLKKYVMTKGCKVNFGVDRKEGQIALLKDFFEDRGFRVETDDYPRYKTSVWGQLVGRMLVGEFGDPLKISPYLTCLPYMIDQYFGNQKIKKWVDKGVVVVSNRYFTSNVHQIVKLEGQDRDNFRKWLWDAGWNRMKIYKPDLVIVLRISPQVAADLIRKKVTRDYMEKKGMDEVEKSIYHQTEAAKEYDRTCKEFDWWKSIECCDGEGKLLTVEKISGKVVGLLKKLELV